MNSITSYAHIKKNTVSVNGTQVFSSQKNATLTEFLSDVYKSLEISYPKFHKMDLQCKLGFLCAEVALKNTNFISGNELNKIAIIISNSASSLQTDKLHQNSIDDKTNYFPSPAVFVYTLPNIIIGELAIKHKITGENAFFISEKFDSHLMVNYTDLILNDNASSAICGWVNVDEDAYEAFIFLVETNNITNKNTIFKPLNELVVTQIYNQS